MNVSEMRVVAKRNAISTIIEMGNTSYIAMKDPRSKSTWLTTSPECAKDQRWYNRQEAESALLMHACHDSLTALVESTPKAEDKLPDKENPYE